MRNFFTFKFRFEYYLTYKAFDLILAPIATNA